MKDATTFNGLDSTVIPQKGKKKVYKNLQNPFPINSVINVSRWLLGQPSVAEWCTYTVVGYKYKKNGRLVYVLQPAIFDEKPVLREVEDSIKLDVWNEGKGVWQSRTDFAQDPQIS